MNLATGASGLEIQPFQHGSVERRQIEGADVLRSVILIVSIALRLDEQSIDITPRSDALVSVDVIRSVIGHMGRDVATTQQGPHSLVETLVTEIVGEHSHRCAAGVGHRPAMDRGVA